MSYQKVIFWLTIHGKGDNMIIAMDKKLFLMRILSGFAQILDGMIVIATLGTVHTSLTFKLICIEAKYRCKNDVEMKMIGRK